MSYFAKPHFIIYDEWFDDDLGNNKIDFKNEKIKNTSNIHEFFYEQSNYKVGASENYLKLFINANKKDIITNKYLGKNLAISKSKTNTRFRFLQKFTKSKLKFNITKRLIYSLSIFALVFIFGFLLFFISESKKNQSNISNRFLILEKVL